MPTINWLSIVIAVIIPLAVGFVWYNEKVFGKAWMDSLGITKEAAQKASMAKIFGLSIVMFFLLSFFILNNVDGPGQEGQYDTFKHGVAHGVLMTLFVAMPIMVVNGLFEMRKWKTMLINIGYWMVSLALMAGVLDAMNHDPF